MSNKMYDTLKTTALIMAPVLVFASTLLNIWNVPYQNELTQSLAALDVLIGALVVAASKMHNAKEE